MAWTQEQATAYAAANPDVLKSFQNDPQNQGITLQQSMEAHYNNFGQKEGRATPTTSALTPASPTTNYAALSAGIQSQPAYDINGNVLKLQDGYRLGGPQFANTIFGPNGQSYGQYYTSPDAAASARYNTQQAINGTAVAGPQTLDQQRQNLRNTLSTGGVSPAAVNKGISFTNTSGGPAKVTNPAQSNILQRLAAALAARRGTSTAGAGTSAVIPTGNSYYSQLARILTQRFGGNGITAASQNGLLKNNSLYSNYLK